MALEGMDGSIPSSVLRAGPWGQKDRGPRAPQSLGALFGVIPIILSQSEAALTVLVKDLDTRAKVFPRALQCELLDMGPVIQ